MPLIQAWQCPETGILFADKAEYQRHLRKRGVLRMEQFKLRKARETFDAHMAEFTKAGSFGDIARWLEENGELICRFNDDRRQEEFKRIVCYQKPKFPDPPSISDVSFNDMRWKDLASNTHTAPKGKPTNWSSRDNPHLPVGYPGWTGTLCYTVANFRGFTNLFNHTPIHTCGGGGTTVRDDKGRDTGATRYRFSVVLYDEEWPLLRLMLKMRGERPTLYSE